MTGPLHHPLLGPPFLQGPRGMAEGGGGVRGAGSPVAPCPSRGTEGLGCGGATLPPCPAPAGSRRPARTLSGAPASASGAASPLVPGSPGQSGGQRRVGKASGGPASLATVRQGQPAGLWSRSRTSVWQPAVSGPSDIVQSPLAVSAAPRQGREAQAQPWGARASPGFRHPAPAGGPACTLRPPTSAPQPGARPLPTPRGPCPHPAP